MKKRLIKTETPLKKQPVRQTGHAFRPHPAVAEPALFINNLLPMAIDQTCPPKRTYFFNPL